MKTITISRLRKKIKYYLDMAAETSEIIIVPIPDQDNGIVILSMGEYNGLTETGYLLGSESNRKRLQESIQQLDPQTAIRNPNAEPPK